MLLLFFSLPIIGISLLIPCFPIKSTSANSLLGISVYPLFLLNINLQTRNEVIFDYLNPFTMMNNIVEALMEYNMGVFKLQNYGIESILLIAYCFIGIVALKSINLISRLGD